MIDLVRFSGRMVSTTTDAPNDDQWGKTQLESGSVSSIDDDQAPKSPSSRKQQNLECPRCSSMNTKFCYYNNYNKSQPRHFCKGCKRHWTKGGTLRNVPIGGGRKNKRLRTSAPAPAPPPTKNQTDIQTDILNFPMTHIKNHPHHQQNNQKHQQNNQNHQQNQQQQLQYPSSSWMLPLHQEQGTLPFSFSNLSHFDSIIPSSFQGSSVDDYVESSSTITSITPTDSAVFSHPWQGPNDWNWDKVDPFISSDLNVSWDDIEINP